MRAVFDIIKFVIGMFILLVLGIIMLPVVIIRNLFIEKEPKVKW